MKELKINEPTVVDDFLTLILEQIQELREERSKIQENIDEEVSKKRNINEFIHYLNKCLDSATIPKFDRKQWLEYKEKLNDKRDQYVENIIKLQ